MKTNHLILIAALCAISAFNPLFSQNTVPEEGNVGIGTTNPAATLDVAGSVKIDSTLTVLDSIVVTKNARIKEDITVEGKTVMSDDATAARELTVEGDAYFNANGMFRNGDVFMPYLIDETYSEDDVLTIDETGKIVRRNVKSLVYMETAAASLLCPEGPDGSLIPIPPSWTRIPNKMYISSECVKNPMVGIGVIPAAKFHIRLPSAVSTYPLLIEKQVGNTITNERLLQLEASGLLRAREIKVDLDSWPDYVFERDYPLMPLEDLEKYIGANLRLPNVPSACEMETEGINVAQTNVMLMEKLEELTLYLLQVQRQVNEQKASLQHQQQLLDQQRETLLSQQQLIEQLQEPKTR